MIAHQTLDMLSGTIISQISNIQTYFSAGFSTKITREIMNKFLIFFLKIVSTIAVPPHPLQNIEGLILYYIIETLFFISFGISLRKIK